MGTLNETGTTQANGHSLDADTDYDSGISVNGQDEIEELEKLIRERLENGGGDTWKLGWSSLGGRGILTTSNIKPGDVIFTDIPIVLGPRGGMEGSPLCVACFKSGIQLKTCSKGCRLPLCSQSCEEKHAQSTECDLLVNLGVQEGDSWSTEVYRALTPFSCLSLAKRDKEIIKMLQAHPARELATEVKLLNRGLKSQLSAADQKWLDLCCRVLDAVAFQAVTDDFESKQSPVRGLYPLAGLMNHSCIPNTRQVFDVSHRLTMVAAKAITEGEEITTSYCPLLWATPLRNTFLLNSKHFVCSCPRCSDPTEMGTCLAGLICSCRGIILPVDPLESQCQWKCNSCTKSLSSRQALIYNSVLFSVPGKSKNNMSLSENNHMIIDSLLKHIFAQRNQLKGMNDTELEERGNQIKHILRIIDQLQLGESRTKGLLLYELYSNDKEKAGRLSGEDFQIPYEFNII